jgi:hypothetical protein
MILNPYLRSYHHYSERARRYRSYRGRALTLIVDYPYLMLR